MIEKKINHVFSLFIISVIIFTVSCETATNISHDNKSVEKLIWGVRLTEKSFRELSKDSLPINVMQVLTAIKNVNYPSKDDFLKYIKENLDTTQYKKYKTRIEQCSYGTIPDVSAVNSKVIYTDSAKLQMKIISTEMLRYQKAKIPYTELKGSVKVLFYNGKPKEESSLKSNYAIFHEQDKLWEFKGKVKLINNQNDVLMTEHLFLNTATEKMNTDSLVTIKYGSGGGIKGKDGFNSNLTFTEFEFYTVVGFE